MATISVAGVDKPVSYVVLLDSVAGTALGTAADPLPVSTTGAYSGYRESIAALLANGTYTGPGRSPSIAAAPVSYFNVTAYADVAGNVYIDLSLDAGSTWQQVATAAVSAGGAATLHQSLVGDFSSNTQYRARYVNGAAGQATFRLGAAFTAA